MILMTLEKKLFSKEKPWGLILFKRNIKDLKNKEMLMREEIHALKNSPTFIAAVARRELGWVKENERVYFFNQEKKSL